MEHHLYVAHRRSTVFKLLLSQQSWGLLINYFNTKRKEWISYCYTRKVEFIKIVNFTGKLGAVHKLRNTKSKEWIGHRGIIEGIKYLLSLWLCDLWMAPFYLLGDTSPKKVGNRGNELVGSPNYFNQWRRKTKVRWNNKQFDTEINKDENR